jgi:hypothetical protein
MEMDDESKVKSFAAYKEIMQCLDKHQLDAKLSLCTLLGSVMIMVKQCSSNPKKTYIECSKIFENEAERNE